MWEHMQYGYDGGYGWMHGGGGWLGMGLIWVLVLAALVAATLWAVRAASGDQPGEGRPTALEILDEHYARGEIDRDDYKARKADLET